MLRSFAIGAVSALALASAASAADMYRAEGPGGYKDGPYVPVNTWAGFYIGANVGGVVGNSDNRKFNLISEGVNDTAEGTFRSKDLDNTVIGGVHVGYNFQRANWVFGVEGDVDFADRIDYLASIRGRIGYDYAGFLIYATGGAAFAGFNSNFSVKQPEDAAPFRFNNDHSETGYVVGAGIEKKLAPAWSVGVEGLYYDFGKNSTTNAYDGGSDVLKTWKDDSFWTVRARLSYHLTGAPYEPLK